MDINIDAPLRLYGQVNGQAPTPENVKELMRTTCFAGCGSAFAEPPTHHIVSQANGEDEVFLSACSDECLTYALRDLLMMAWARRGKS